MGPSHKHMVAIAIQTESCFVAEDNVVIFGCDPIPSSITELPTEATCVGVIGSTYNGLHCTKCAALLNVLQKGALQRYVQTGIEYDT